MCEQGEFGRAILVDPTCHSSELACAVPTNVANAAPTGACGFGVTSIADGDYCMVACADGYAPSVNGGVSEVLCDEFGLDGYFTCEPCVCPTPPPPTTTAPATRDPNATTTPAPAPTPVVEVSLRLQVDNPVGFVNDEANWAAMEAAVADMAEVDVDDVIVNLTVVNVTRRRLRDTEERFLQDSAPSQEVRCDATISVANTADGNTVQNLVEDLTPEEITTFAQTALEEAGLDVTVTVAAAPTVDVQQAATPPSPPPSTQSGQASAAGVRWKAFSLAPFFAVSAWILSNV
jgi:hypothetical protein